MVSLKETQENVMRYKLLNERVKMLDSRRQLLISKILEIEATSKTLEELEKSNDILLPLGSGVYIKGSVGDKNKLIVMLSRSIAVDMSIEKTKETLEKNKKTLENGLNFVENDIEKITQEMLSLEPAVREYFERQQKLSGKNV